MSHVDPVELLFTFAFGAWFAWAVLISVGARFPRFARKVVWLFPALYRPRIHYAVGDVGRALEVLRAGSIQAPVAVADRWNFLTCLLIANGQYHEAIAAGPARLGRAIVRKNHPDLYAIIVINQAEALYNLGRWRRAERLMGALAASGLCRSPIALAGGTAQLAWILASSGRAAEAAWLLGPVQPAWLPREYVAELHFTRALVAMNEGRLDAAVGHLDDADRRLFRASSRRNALFLRARLWAATGRGDEAIVLCQAASAATYRGQGGDGLLLWGDLLQGNGRREEARGAWQLAIDRDAQSDSARIARERLAGATR